MAKPKYKQNLIPWQTLKLRVLFLELLNVSSSYLILLVQKIFIIGVIRWIWILIKRVQEMRLITRWLIDNTLSIIIAICFLSVLWVFNLIFFFLFFKILFEFGKSSFIFACFQPISAISNFLCKPMWSHTLKADTLCIYVFFVLNFWLAWILIFIFDWKYFLRTFSDEVWEVTSLYLHS